MLNRKGSAKANTYSCPFTPEPIRIDGFLEEPAWRNAKLLDFFIPVTFEKPISKTEARLLWDKDYLYAGFKAYDRDIWGYYTERDERTCDEDVLEVFLKTEPGEEPYYNFEINALGTVFDAFNIRRGGAGGDHRWSKWNCEGLEVGIHIEGTLNNWEDEDEYWQMEVAIPFADLPGLKGRVPQSGDEWLFHLSRYDYSIYLPEGVELSSCARLSQVNFHLYEDWLTLRFEG